VTCSDVVDVANSDERPPNVTPVAIWEALS